MVALYVANATKQNQEWHYRTGVGRQMRRLSIMIGRQTKATEDLTAAEAQFIIDKAAKYGFVTVQEALKIKRYVGLVYSLDRPVSESSLRLIMGHNHERLVYEGEDIRRDAAVATSNILDQRLADEPSSPDILATEIGIMEEERRVPSDTKPVSEMFTMDKNAPQDRPTATKSRPQTAAQQQRRQNRNR